MCGNGSRYALCGRRRSRLYLLGSKGPGAAITPPPSWYFQNDLYFYRDELGGNKQLSTDALGVDGSAVIDTATLIWVAPETVLGGNLGLNAIVPFGWKKTSADLTVGGPLGGIATGSVSDPIVGGFLGWHPGNFHYQVGTLVNVPIGDYQDGEISNISFNYWGSGYLRRSHVVCPHNWLGFVGCRRHDV